MLAHLEHESQLRIRQSEQDNQELAEQVEFLKAELNNQSQSATESNCNKISNLQMKIDQLERALED
jgi:hypothetical protein